MLFFFFSSCLKCIHRKNDLVLEISGQQAVMSNTLTVMKKLILKARPIL